jgi:multisubunit Na+/H+ antiporter MnhE subunit
MFVMGVAQPGDLLVWLCLVWTAFRVSDTVALLGSVAGTAVTGAVRRHLTRRRTARKWQAFKDAHPDLFEGR